MEDDNDQRRYMTEREEKGWVIKHRQTSFSSSHGTRSTRARGQGSVITS